MKVFKKRLFAYLIDSFAFGIAFAIFQLGFPQAYAFILKYDLLLCLMFVPFFFKDVLFRNASLGKKIMRISIYDNNWKKPNVKTLFLRALRVTTVGYVMIWRAILTGEGVISVLDWEREKIGTRVIDKRIYAEIDSKAKDMNGNYAKNMSELYNEYLRKIYLK